MKTTIISAQVRVNVESNARTVVMNTADEFDFIDAQNGFAHGKRKMLVMGYFKILGYLMVLLKKILFIIERILVIRK